MALASAIKGATRPAQSITWTRNGSTTGETLTGATITGKIRNTSTQAVREIVGILEVTDGANGVFVWNYDAADVAEAGMFSVQFTATFGAPPTPARTFIGHWLVEDAL